MAHLNRLIFHDGSAVTNFYISGGGTYTGSGTPWTTAGGSPYEIAMNEATGEKWTPANAETQAVYGGGPPFRFGQILLYKSNGNVIERVPIQMKVTAGATAHDNAVFLKQLLSKVLNTAQYSVPCLLACQPDNSTNIAYFEIFHADIQETHHFINDENGVGTLRAVITWERGPFAANISTGETAISSVSITARGTSSPDDVEAYAASPSGDLIYEGQPLNLTVTPTTASQDIFVLFLGSIHSRAYATTGSGTLAKTFGGASPTPSAGPTFDASAALTRRGLRARCIASFSNVTANCQVQLLIKTSGSTATGPQTLYTLKATARTVSGATLIDFGSWPIDLVYRRPFQATTFEYATYWTVDALSAGTAQATLNSFEFILYYDFARVDCPTGLSAATASSQYILVDQYQEQTNAPLLPYGGPNAYIMTSTNRVRGVCVIRGTPPRLWSGASLYCNWMRGGDVYTTTDTATIVARQSGLYRSFRGAD